MTQTHLSSQTTQSHMRLQQTGMHASIDLMLSRHACAFQPLRRQTIGLMLSSHECQLMADESTDWGFNYEEYCVISQNLQGAGFGSRHRLSAFARGAAMFMVR